MTDNNSNNSEAETQVVDRDEATATPCLTVVSGNQMGQMFPIDRDEMIIGRSDEADLRLSKQDISREHARIEVEGDDNVTITDLESANGTYLDGEQLTETERLHDGNKISIGESTILQFSLVEDVKRNFQNKLLETAIRDELTRAYNKSYFLNQLETEFSFASRHDTELIVMLFEIDDFEHIIDEQSDRQGDSILIEFVDLLEDQIRTEDILARYTGSEFIIAAREIPPEDAAAMANRLRKEVASHSFGQHDEDKAFEITTSVGVAAYPSLDISSPEALVRAADQALYAAKNLGENRVTIKQ